MKSLDSKPNGGLILDKKELLPILNEPDAIGLAFALQTAGQADDVDLKVLKVYKDGNILKGAQRPVHYKKGAPGPMHYPALNKEAFKFRYWPQLVKDGFLFGFYSKEKFNLLFKDGWDELFIGGGKKTFPNTDFVGKETWFTLTIYLRRKIIPVKMIADSSVGLNVQEKFSNANIMQTAILHSNGTFTPDSLQKAHPKVFNKNRKVASIILKKNEAAVKGLVFQENGRLFPVLFNGKQKISSFSLNLDGTLKLLSPAGLAVEEASKEAMAFGVFPYADHMDPCPPDWHWEGSDNSIKDAVADALQEKVTL